MNLRILLPALALAGLPAALAAQEASTPVDAVVQQVLQANPAFDAARLKWEAMQQRPDIARALPDPMVTYGYYLQNVETRVGAMNQKLTLSQKVPLFGKRGLAATKAEKEALMAMWDYQRTGRELILRARLACIDLYRIDRSREILQAQLDLLQSIGQTAQSRYEAGRAPQQDVLKIRVATTEVQNKLMGLAQQRATALARLNALRGRPAGTALVPEPPPAPAIPTADNALAVGRQYRQELRSAGVSIERNEIALELARKDRLPDFTFGVDYTQINQNTMSDPPDNGRDAMMGFVSVNVPIWRGKLRAEALEAEKNLAAARAERRNVELALEGDVADALARAHAAQDQLTLYDASLLPAAGQSLAATRSTYETGGSGFIDLLDAERALLNLQIGRVMAVADRARAMAALERAVGVDIDRIPGTTPSPEDH